MNEIELTEEQKVEAWIAAKKVEAANLSNEERFVEATQLRMLVGEAEKWIADFRVGKVQRKTRMMK
jgi:hypothetical protein